MPSPIKMIEFTGENVSAPTGSHFGKLLTEISARPDVAAQAGQFVLAFSDYGAPGTPPFAAPRVRELCRALDAGCPHATFFLTPDPAYASIQVYLLALTPVRQVGTNWGYDLKDYLATTQEHTRRVSAFARKIGVDVDTATEGLLLNLPPEVLKNLPDVRDKILGTLAPLLRSLDADLERMQLDPQGREIAEQMMSRGAVLTGVPWNGKPERATLNAILARLPHA